MIQRWLRHAVKKNAIRAACALHAHLAYMYYWTVRNESWVLQCSRTLEERENSKDARGLKRRRTCDR